MLKKEKDRKFVIKIHCFFNSENFLENIFSATEEFSDIQITPVARILY